MAALAEDAVALLVAVEAERGSDRSERSTQASDDDLDAVAGVLRAVARPDRSDGGAALAGVIARTVTDRWSLTADLSERLVAFDHRLGRHGR